jgi:hypothetical protein
LAIVSLLWCKRGLNTARAEAPGVQRNNDVVDIIDSALAFANNLSVVKEDGIYAEGIIA